MKKGSTLIGAIVLIVLNLIILLGSVNVSAVGIAGDTSDFVFFYPGFTKTYEFMVISNTDRPMEHVIELNGDLAPYFKASKQSLFIEQNGAGWFTATMTLPQNLTPGEHVGYVCALESQARGGGGGENVIGTRVRVCSVFKVFSAYPGIYVDFDLYTKDINQGEDETIQMTVTNYGTENVTVNGVIDIYFNNFTLKTEDKIGSLNTNTEFMKMGEQKVLQATLSTKNLEIGEYRAVATLYYPGNQTTKERGFRMGDVHVAIVNFTDTAARNKLNMLKINARSNWNQKIEEVYSSIEILDSQGKIISSMKSPPVSINPWETSTLSSYWDTNGLNLTQNEYDMKVTLHYQDKNTTSTGKMKIINERKISMMMILIVILIILVLVLIVAIIIIMRKMHKSAKSINKAKTVKVKRKR